MNRFKGNMIIVDTTDTQVGGIEVNDVAVGIGPKGPLSIKAIKWVSNQNSGKDIVQNDDLTILWGKKDGTKIIEVRATEATPQQVAFSIEFGSSPWEVPGLYCEDLDGGELIIWLA